MLQMLVNMMDHEVYFTFLNISGPHAAIAEMERQMSISEDVVRYLTISVEALEEGPSAMMRRRDDRKRDDEGFSMNMDEVM